VLEVDSCLVREAGLLLQRSMESAASLLGIIFAPVRGWFPYFSFELKFKLVSLFFSPPVPLLVKLKVGKTWGSLETFQPES